MTWSTANLTKPVRAVALVLLAGLAGCVLGDNSDPPVLSVDLYWRLRGNHRAESTCESSNVASMEFQLIDTHTGAVAVDNEDTESGRECLDGFNFVDVGPGDYRLDVKGYDADQNQLWSGSCDLSLSRFDRLYSCDVNMSSQTSSGSGNGDDQDAGV
jgi:hypothetical protein